MSDSTEFHVLDPRRALVAAAVAALSLPLGLSAARAQDEPAAETGAETGAPAGSDAAEAAPAEAAPADAADAADEMTGGNGADQAAADQAAAVEEIDAPYYVSWLEARVRAEPASTSPVLSTLAFGDRVNVTGRLADLPWFRVELPDGTAGYVWQDVLAPLDFGNMAVAGGGEPGSAANDDSPESAHEVGPLSTSPAVFEDTIGPMDIADYYRVEITDWTSLGLLLDGMTADADLYIRTETGETLTSSNISGPEADSLSVVVGPGTYYVSVESFEGETPYTLSLTGSPAEPPPPDQAGDTADTALDLALAPDGTAQQTEWVGPGDVADMFRFTTPGRTLVRATIPELMGDVDLQILQEDGTSLAYGGGGPGSQATVTALVGAGTYDIAVTSYGTATPYTMDVALTDPARLIQEIGPIQTTPTSYSGAVTEPSGSTFQGFTVTEPALAMISLQPTGGDLDMELLDAKTLSLIGSSALGGTSTETILTPLQPGGYLVRIYALGDPSPYNLVLVANPMMTAPPQQ